MSLDNTQRLTRPRAAVTAADC